MNLADYISPGAAGYIALSLIVALFPVVGAAMFGLWKRSVSPERQRELDNEVAIRMVIQSTVNHLDGRVKALEKKSPPCSEHEVKLATLLQSHLDLKEDTAEIKQDVKDLSRAFGSFLTDWNNGGRSGL